MTDNNMTLANRLKNTRKERSLSQTDLAKIANVSQQAISEWERGITTKPKDLDLIAKALKVNLEWLKHNTPPKNLKEVDEVSEKIKILNKENLKHVNFLIDSYIKEQSARKD